MNAQIKMASPVIRWGPTATVDSSSLEGMPGRVPSSDALSAPRQGLGR